MSSLEISVFFTWKADMVQSELYVLSRLSQIKGTLPPTANFVAHRLTFAAFPIIGISLTSKTRSPRELWEAARYQIKPRFLRVPGVARVDLVGGRTPEIHVVADPDLDDDIRRDMAQWTGCIAGALTMDQYRALLKDAGLTAIEVNETHRVHPHAGSAIIRASRPAEPPGGGPLPPGVVRLQGPGFLHVPVTIPW